jgi:hypothetical protein
MFGSQQALTGSQVSRGAYINSGSRDVGPDPDYDFKTGTWKGRRNKVGAEREAEAKPKPPSQVTPP